MNYLVAPAENHNRMLSESVCLGAGEKKATSNDPDLVGPPVRSFKNLLG